jgi:hypothetical protein
MSDLRKPIAVQALLVAAVVLSCLASLRTPALAQTFNLDASRLPIAQIDSAWRYHLGDDLDGKKGWSQPAFNDSNWPTLNPTEDWTTQGIPTETELAWFRFHLLAPAHTQSLVLELPSIPKSYQLFVNGRLIAQVGTLPPGPARNVIGAARVFTVPVNSGANPKEIAVALRTWQDLPLAGTRPSVVEGQVFIGSPNTVLDHFTATKSASLLSDGSIYTIDLVKLIVGISAAILFWLTRERFYLWYAITLVVDTCFFASDLIAAHQAWDFSLYTYSNILIDIATAVFFILFIVDALYPNRWKPAIVPALLMLAADGSIMLVLAFNFPKTAADITYCLSEVSSSLILVWYAVRSLRSGNFYAKLLIFPLAIHTLGNLGNNFGEFLLDLNVRFGLKLIPSRYILLHNPFVFDLEQFETLVALLGFLAVLIYRFALTSREKQRLASALQAAHDIQNRLVPIDIPTLGGLQTEIAYRAAEEVGGDFCQVLPRPDGSILVAIGDVSGKGLQAAMLGALAVGALRSVADERLQPAAALERLNQVLLRTQNQGFITCLCMVLTEYGEVIIANAGHLSPYLDGIEVPVENGLPLGIISGVTYDQHTFELPAVARLTLLSDGVVEARSRSGELFGFERTSELSRRPASEIADTAHQFGQEDDITVITLDWNAVYLIPA